MVFRSRIDDSRRLKEAAVRRIDLMQGEMSTSVAARAKAEAAKRKSDEVLARELALKKEGEHDIKEAQKLISADSGRAASATQKVAALQAEGSQASLGVREKDEVLELMTNLQQLSADTDLLHMQLKRNHM